MIATDMATPLTAPERRSPTAARRRPPGAPRPSASRPPREPDRAPKRALHPVRRIVIGVLIGAVTMLAVTLLDRFADTSVPVLSTLATLPDPAAAEARRLADLPPPPAEAGTCLNWTRADAADTVAVPCGQPHRFEQAGSVQVTDQAALPDDRMWRQLVGDRCTPMVAAYLGDKFDQDGRFRVGALKPSQAKWAEGERSMRCGLQTNTKSGSFLPITGKVADQDQSKVEAAGTCLAIDGRTVGDPVSCAGPHAVETVGVVDLTEQFKDGKYPSVDDQDKYLQTKCGEIAAQYAGSAEPIAQKKLTVYWDNVAEQSWQVGSHKVNCNLAALLPDRSGFAPVTGSAKGPVTVAGTPAPPTQPGTPSSPGAPADGSSAPTSPVDAPPGGTTAEPPVPIPTQVLPLPGSGGGGGNT